MLANKLTSVLNVFIIGITLMQKHTEHHTTVSHTQLLVKQMPSPPVIAHLFLYQASAFLQNKNFANAKPKKCKPKIEDAVLFSD